MALNDISYINNLFVGSSDKSHCTELAKYLQTLCQQLGIPIILTKVRVLRANFWGLRIDTVTQNIFIQTHNCSEIHNSLGSLLQSNKFALKQMQSLCGLSNFFAKGVFGGRPFCRCFCNATIDIKKSYFLIKVLEYGSSLFKATMVEPNSLI